MRNLFAQMLGLVFAAVAAFNYAATPAAAAVQAVRYPGRAPAAVARTDVVGSFATVLLSGAVVEGAPFTEAILLRRFAFGWQPLDAVGSHCVFAARHIDRDTERLLERGMPPLPGRTSCEGAYGNDYGPPRAVDAVRKIARGPFVPFVAVYRDWAKSVWYGAGGGEHYYRLQGGVWRFAFGGGGAYRAKELRGRGVPAAALCAFRTFDATCSTRPNPTSGRS